MGHAAGYFKAAISKFDNAQKVVFGIPANYQENFKNKYEEACKARDKAITENKNIYFERETPENQIPKPDMQNFVKLEALVEDLNGKLPIEDKLRHIVPPAVRALQEELKNLLQDIVNQHYEVDQKQDAEQKAFLSQHGLP